MNLTIIKTEDDARDLAIRINDALVEAGFIPDCTDTNDEAELEAQDIITQIIASNFNINLE